jgi:Tol biopolymer transport system component
MPLSEGTPTQITSDPLATHAIPRWSADGQFLYFYFTRDAVSFARVSASGGEAETIVPGWDWSVANGASVSPDETQIAYSRLTGQAPVQTLIRQLATGKDEGFYATLEYPRWSADGTDIIGALHVDQRFPGDIAQCPVTGPECRIIARGARIPMFSPDESRIFYVRGFGPSQDLFVAPLSGEHDERRLMTMAPLFPLGPFYDITEDGKIVWVRYEQEPSEIWLAQLGD